MNLFFFFSLYQQEIVEKVAGKSEEYPNWGMLDEIGLTDDVLCEVVLNDSLVYDSSSLSDPPSHGILIELYHFCQRFSDVSTLKANILKKCIDVFFFHRVLFLELIVWNVEYGVCVCQWSPCQNRT